MKDQAALATLLSPLGFALISSHNSNQVALRFQVSNYSIVPFCLITLTILMKAARQLWGPLISDSAADSVDSLNV